MKIIKGWLVATVALGMVVIATSSYAIPTLFISDGVGDTEVVGTGASTVTTGGSLGVWTLTFGQATEVTGGTSPSLSLFTLDASVTGAAGNAPYNLYVWFGDVNFGPTSSSFLAKISGATTGKVTYNTYADLGNNLFGTSLALTTQSFGSGIVNGSQSTGSGFFPFAYSLSQEIIITQTGGGITTVNATLTDPPGISTVPEGGMTLVLLGSSLIALWAFGRFTKSVRA
jgi:hypothetical protein